MMRLPAFEYRAPRDLGEAVSLLADAPDTSRLVAGGTDLWPNMKRRHQSASRVIALARVPGLSAVQGSPDQGLRIGAMTTLTALAKDPVVRSAYPGLAMAAASISSPLLRNMGTLGGNLCLDTRCTYYNQSEEWRKSIGYCMKEVGDICWVAPSSPRCWAISATDSAPLLSALGARVVLRSTTGERDVPVAALFVDDGIDYLAKRRDEILTEVLVPAATGVRSTYWKLRRRESIDFPVLGVGAMVRRDSAGRLAEARVFLGAVASSPLEVKEAGPLLVGSAGGPEEVARVAAAGAATSTPMDNTDFVLQWRRKMVARYVEGALREVLDLETTVRPPPDGRRAIAV